MAGKTKKSEDVKNVELKEKKTTKATNAKAPVETVEEPVVNTEEVVEPIKQETTETVTAVEEEVTEVKEEEVTDTDVDATITEEPVDTTVDGDEDATITEEPAEVAKEESENEETIDEAINEFLGKDAGQKLQELVDKNPNDLEGALKDELSRVSDIEAKVREEVKKNEAKVKKNRKINYIYQDSLGNFWNGVSDGWNN